MFSPKVAFSDGYARLPRNAISCQHATCNTTASAINAPWFVFSYSRKKKNGTAYTIVYVRLQQKTARPNCTLKRCANTSFLHTLSTRTAPRFKVPGIVYTAFIKRALRALAAHCANSKRKSEREREYLDTTFIHCRAHTEHYILSNERYMRGLPKRYIISWYTYVFLATLFHVTQPGPGQSTKIRANLLLSFLSHKNTK